METKTQNPTETLPFYKKRQFFLVILLIIGIGLAFFFGTRAFRNFDHMRERKIGGGETNVELIRGWMTVDYITKMYHVPPDVVLKVFNLPVQSNMNRSLGSLIKNTGTSNPEDLLIQVKKNINDFQQKDLKSTPQHPPDNHP